MAEVIGCISACLSIAQVIAAQVDKLVKAPANLRHISSDTALIGRILHHIYDAVSPDSTGPKHVELSPEAAKLTLHCVRRCEVVFGEIHLILRKILGEEKALDGNAKMTFYQRLYYSRFDSDLRTLREELKASKQNIVLINSVNQMILPRHGAQLNDGVIDEMKVIIQLLHDNQKAGVAILPSAPQPPPPPSAMVNTSVDVSHINNGPREPILPGSAEPPPKTTAVSHQQAAVPRPENIVFKFPRDAVPMQWLRVANVRWLNDPFEQNMINIHDPIPDERLSQICAQSHRVGDSNELVNIIKGAKRISRESVTKDSQDAETRIKYEHIRQKELAEREYAERLRREKLEMEMKLKVEESARKSSNGDPASKLAMRRRQEAEEEEKRQREMAIERARVKMEQTLELETARRRAAGLFKSKAEPSPIIVEAQPNKEDFSDSDTTSQEDDESLDEEEEYINRLAANWARPSPLPPPPPIIIVSDRERSRSHKPKKKSSSSRSESSGEQHRRRSSHH